MGFRLVIRNILFFTLLLSSTHLSSCATPSSARTQAREARLLLSLPQTPSDATDFAYERLIKAGVSKEFALWLKNAYSKDHIENAKRETIVSLNVFGFLAHSDYSLHYSANAVKKTKEFVAKYSKTLKLAESRYQVPKEVLASLLWVETKHGKYTGNFNLPMVYYSLLQADHPAIAKITLEELNNRKPAAIQANPAVTEEMLEQKVIDRSIKKAAWALEQLKAIDQLYQKGMRHLLKTRASFAGAFGFPQFIPTTYSDYAVALNRKEPDLFNMRDAILSVGHYLKAKGWDNKNPQAQSDALFEYNRARDYGAVILKIAGETQKGKHSL